MADDTQKLVAHRYVLGAMLGAGGMGKVWSAEDQLLGRTVAVKAVDLRGHGDEVAESALRTRVMREARAAARIDHPGSVRIFDVVDEGHTVYLVMELVQAPTLAQVVAADGPLDAATAASIGLDVLGALAEAHRVGIVHRDVKPNNVMVLPGGRGKLADFGIASVKDDPGLTATGLVLGTPNYMSPEQARGDTAGAAADTWGLGALLYFAVEGVPPFDRKDALPTLNAVLLDPPRPPERAGPLGPILADLLAKVPEARPGDEETLELLAPIAGGTATTDVAPARPLPRAPHVPGASPDRPRRWLAPVAVLAVVLAAAVAGILLTGDDDPPSSVAGEAGTTTTTVAAGAGAAPTTAAEATTTSTTAPSTTSTSTTTTAAPADPGGRPGGVPADWQPYDGDGWRIWHPPGWEPRATRPSSVDFTDGNGDYLRVDTVARSSGDPVAAWESQEAAFRASRRSYKRIRLEPTEFRGSPAAIWEFTWEDKHAADLGFAVGERGFALNLVTARSRWEERADEFLAFQAGFTPR